MEILNRLVFKVIIEVEELDLVNNSIDIGEIIREEIRSVLGDTKSGKVLGVDSITVDFLRVDIDIIVNVLYELFNKIW